MSDNMKTVIGALVVLLIFIGTFIYYFNYERDGYSGSCMLSLVENVCGDMGAQLEPGSDSYDGVIVPDILSSGSYWRFSCLSDHQLFGRVLVKRELQPCHVKRGFF